MSWETRHVRYIDIKNRMQQCHKSHLIMEKSRYNQINASDNKINLQNQIIPTRIEIQWWKLSN